MVNVVNNSIIFSNTMVCYTRKGFVIVYQFGVFFQYSAMRSCKFNWYELDSHMRKRIIFYTKPNVVIIILIHKFRFNFKYRSEIIKKEKNLDYTPDCIRCSCKATVRVLLQKVEQSN